MAGNDYTWNHRRESRAARKRSGDCCEFCGRPNRTVELNQKGKPWMLYLEGAHKNHDKENPNAVYLCLCPVCHHAYDRAYKEALKELNALVKVEMKVTPLDEGDVLRRHVRLRADEASAWQAHLACGGQDAELRARALWCSCKRWWFEVQIARRCVARCRTGRPASSGFQELLAFCKTKQSGYQAALARYQQAVGHDVALHVQAMTGREEAYAGTL